MFWWFILPTYHSVHYVVKSLTGNIEVIRTLNKFGHGVSYDQLEENDTATVSPEVSNRLQPESCSTSFHQALCLHKSCMG